MIRIDIFAFLYPAIDAKEISDKVHFHLRLLNINMKKNFADLQTKPNMHAYESLIKIPNTVFTNRS